MWKLFVSGQMQIEWSAQGFTHHKVLGPIGPTFFLVLVLSEISKILIRWSLISLKMVMQKKKERHFESWVNISN